MGKVRFTLRIKEDERRELSRIKGLTGTKTNTQAIRFLISNFVELNRRYTDEIGKNALLKEEYRQQDQCVATLLETIQELEVLKNVRVVVAERKKNKGSDGK